MAPKQKQFETRFKCRAWLYRFVFYGRIPLLVVLILVTAFLIQPINQAMAQTPESLSVADDVAEQNVDTETTIDNSDDSSNEVSDESVTENIPEDALNLAEVVTPTETDVDNAIEEIEEEIVEPQDILDEEELDTPVPEIFDEEAVDVKTLDELQSEVQDELEPREDTVKEIQYLVNDDNFYQFNRQSCVSVGDGSYHCTNKDVPNLDTSTVVFTDKGETGAQQIFLRTANGSVKQITSGNEDNTSPYYDADSMQVVWQRMIDGRYQIIIYDIRENKERQLTFSRTNNMEPKASTEGVVWQAWDGNDWEIMYFDGTFTDQLTDNDIQDVTPAVEDGYVLWSVLGGADQEAKVYSLESKELLTITGYEGGTIANPRFVLVYDTRFENGDIITQGFDPATGLSTPLGVAPAQKPIEIPNVDPLGEVRALINSKTQHEDDLDSALHPDTGGLSDTLHIEKASSTDTLNLKTDVSDSTSLQVSSTTPTQNDFELTDYDLVLVPADFSSTEPTPAGTLVIDSAQ